jgi:hypothetical protein
LNDFAIEAKLKTRRNKEGFLLFPKRRSQEGSLSIERSKNRKELFLSRFSVNFFILSKATPFSRKAKGVCKKRFSF